MKSFRRWRDGSFQRRRSTSNSSRSRVSRQVPVLEGLEERVVMSFAALPGEVYLTGPAAGDPLLIALNHLSQHGADQGFTAADVNRLIVTDKYTSSVSGTTHIYLRQSFNGLEVTESDININVTREGRVLNVGGGFSPVITEMPQTGVPTPTLSAVDAVRSAGNILGYPPSGEVTLLSTEERVDQRSVVRAPGASLDDVEPFLQYVVGPNGEPVLAWEVVLRTPDGQHWFETSVDAQTGALLRVGDWMANASYRAFEWPKASPLDGARTLITDPHLAAPNASPYGWHDTNGQTGGEFTDTRGNNVEAQEDADADNQGGARPDGGAGLNFDFPFDPTQAPSSYQNAAITNLFYWNNVIHDITYQYGFDEPAGNFQRNNYGNGGAENDPVLADAIDGSGTNNANFGTPPDGQSGRMQMFVWTFSNPNRTSDFANDIVIHEYGHGVSNRLTGGPSNAFALQTLQSGSMGEGWSDFLSLMLTQTASDQPNDAYEIGEYVLPGGIRRFPYSFDTNIYPLTYGDVSGFSVHSNGEIWASALWDLNWLLIQRQGFDQDLYTGVDLDDPSSSSGNKIALQLYMYAMAIQPANPTYLQARNAVLQADLDLFGGAYAPEIWTAFARRGMGFSARDLGTANTWNVIESFDVPNFVEVEFASLSGIRENQALSGFTVGQLRDRIGLGGPDEYTVTVDWGDGNGAQTAQLLPSGDGAYNIIASHEYREGGNYTVTIVADRQGSIPTTSQSNIQVISEPIFAEPGSDIQGQENEARPEIRVASFQDFDPEVNPLFHYTATIDWGDGTLTLGTIQPNPLGGFDVFGQHDYQEGGDFNYRVTVTEAGGNSAVAIGSADISSFPIEVSGGLAVSGQEGSSFNGKIGAFRDLDPGFNPERNYVATIEWGDGVVTTGTVVAKGGGNFDVLGQHVFRRGVNGESNLEIKLTVLEKGGNSGTANSSATVTDAPISAEPVDIRTVEGFYEGPVARFLDFNPNGRPEEFTAMIVWGDGAPPTPGKIVPGQDGLFDVVPITPHLFGIGLFPVVVEIVGIGLNPSRSSTSSTATIADAPIAARGVPIIASEASELVDVRVAAFTDQNPVGKAEDFYAVIDWGTGLPTAGKVVADAQGGFSVLGSHAYAVGTYPVNVTIFSKAGNRVATRTNATITDAALRNDPIPVETVEIARNMIVLAAVFDANPRGTANELSVQVNWGDGSVSPGEVVPGPGGGFVILGYHAFAMSGTYPIVATVQSKGGSQTVINTTAQVNVLTIPVTGTLDAASDTGSAVGDGVTSNSQPMLRGHAAPGSTVRITARDGSGQTIDFGETTADPVTGNWTVQAPGLEEGSYQVIATATNRAGRASSPAVTLNSGAPIVIDQTSPRVQNIVYNASARQLQVVLSDAGGLDMMTLANPSHYTFADINGRSLGIRNVMVLPPGMDGSQTVLIDVNGGATASTRARGRVTGGNYLIAIDGNQVFDRAGNNLTETFYKPFPQLGPQPVSTYLAQIGVAGLQQYVPPSAIEAATATRRFIGSAIRRRPLFR